MWGETAPVPSFLIHLSFVAPFLSPALHSHCSSFACFATSRFASSPARCVWLLFFAVRVRVRCDGIRACGWCCWLSSDPLPAVSCAHRRAVLPSALGLFVCRSTFVCSPLFWLWFLVLV